MKTDRPIPASRALELEANFLDRAADELTHAKLTREQLAQAWRSAAAAIREQAATLRALSIRRAG